MANTLTTQVQEDGNRNCIVKLTGVMPAASGSDIAYQLAVTASARSSMTCDGINPPMNFMVKEIHYIIEDGLSVDLWWDDTSSVVGTGPGNAAVIAPLEGRGHLPAHSYSFIRNNSPAPTGNIGLSTNGFQVGTELSYSITLILVKKDVL